MRITSRLELTSGRHIARRIRIVGHSTAQGAVRTLGCLNACSLCYFFFGCVTMLLKLASFTKTLDALIMLIFGRCSLVLIRIMLSFRLHILAIALPESICLGQN